MVFRIFRLQYNPIVLMIVILMNSLITPNYSTNILIRNSIKQTIDTSGKI